MPIRAVVFDFDGVIVDSEPAHAHAIEAALARIGVPFPGKHDYTRYIGRGDRECLVEVATEHGRNLDEPAIAQLVSYKAEAFLSTLSGGFIKPYEATIALLHAASARGPVALCSGSQRESVLPVLDMLGLTSRLATIVTASDARRNKPDPEPYLLTAQRLGLHPSECVAIEDSPTGIRAARAAGYTVHAVCHSFPRERLTEATHIHDSSAMVRVEHLLGQI